MDNHVAKLKQSYEDDWLKAAASLPFEEYQALPENKEQPSGLLRSTYDSARDEFGIKETASSGRLDKAPDVSPAIRESRTVEPVTQNSVDKDSLITEPTTQEIRAVEPAAQPNKTTAPRTKEVQAKVDKPETTVKFDRASAKPETIVPTTKGETDYGEISEERYPKVGREKGKIIFEYGKESKNERYGLTHIEKGHKKQIEKLGETVEDFVYSTTTDPDEIRKGAHGSILLAKKLKIKNLNKVAFVRLQPIKDSAYYRVETAFPMSKRQVEKYRLLWEKSDTSPADSDNQSSFAATTSDTVSDEGPTGTPEQSRNRSPQHY